MSVIYHAAPNLGEIQWAHHFHYVFYVSKCIVSNLLLYVTNIKSMFSIYRLCFQTLFHVSNDNVSIVCFQYTCNLRFEMYLVNRTIDRTVRTVRILWTANSPNSSHSANSSNNEQCEQFILCEQCERRTVRTVRSVRTVRTTNSANSSYYANGANSEQCEQFTLGEQCERRTVRTVRFFEIVEHGEQCEQVRTLFGGPWFRVFNNPCSKGLAIKWLTQI